jgi:NAD(P)-dependent dehydrogenase (short-subunit alcohol dehydrogenase family)
MNTSIKPTPDTSEFSGKRILVTGGTKGVGKAIADRFQQGGATVIITARSASTEKTDNHFIQADVSTAEGTTRVINEILNRFQGIDIIIHNVGGTSAPSGGFSTVTDEIWQQSMNTQASLLRAKRRTERRSSPAIWLETFPAAR